MLAAIGLYGVLAFTVARRTNEIGLRMALGARPAQIVRLILRESSSMMLVGGALGAAGAYVGQRFIRGLLFGIGSSDQSSVLMAAAILCAVAVCATLIPARQALRISPVQALRHE